MPATRSSRLSRNSRRTNRFVVFQTQKSPAHCRALMLASIVRGGYFFFAAFLAGAFLAAFFAGAFFAAAFFAAFFTAKGIPRLDDFLLLAPFLPAADFFAALLPPAPLLLFFAADFFAAFLAGAFLAAFFAGDFFAAFLAGAFFAAFFASAVLAAAFLAGAFFFAGSGSGT